MVIGPLDKLEGDVSAPSKVVCMEAAIVTLMRRCVLDTAA